MSQQRMLDTKTTKKNILYVQALSSKVNLLCFYVNCKLDSLLKSKRPKVCELYKIYFQVIFK